jgi:4-hydroxy-2-oxoheptanedioate aldolase
MGATKKMATNFRLNRVIAALEAGRPAFATFAAPEISLAQSINSAPYDGVAFEMEHYPYDIHALRDCLQYMLDRRQILDSGTLAPAVTPLVRVPANGGEMNQWIVKQVLDVGVYGVIFPHVSTVDEAYNAVASCRYSRPSSAANHQPAGVRGDGPRGAVPYWGITQLEYYKRADVWPLNPAGEIFVGIMCEEVRAVKNLPSILEKVPGISMVLIGEGDLSQDMGYPRQYEHPSVVAAMNDILATCKQYNVACGYPHVGVDNIDALLEKGYRFLMAAPTLSFAALERGRKILSGAEIPINK